MARKREILSTRAINCLINARLVDCQSDLYGRFPPDINKTLVASKERIKAAILNGEIGRISNLGKITEAELRAFCGLKQKTTINRSECITAIKELTDAIDGLFMGQEIDINGHLSYILRVEDVNATIRLAKKYQQLIEGKS